MGRARAELTWTPSAPLAAMAAWPVDRLERQWLDSYRTRPSDVRRTVLGMRAVPGLRAKATYLASVAALSTGRPGRRRARSGHPSRWSPRRSP